MSRAARVLSPGLPTPCSALFRAGGAHRACGAAWGCPSRRHPPESTARLTPNRNYEPNVNVNGEPNLKLNTN